MLFLDEVEVMNGFTCGGADILRILKFVNLLLDIVFIIVPIALIIMVSLDFAKNVIANKEDEMRKNAGVAIKRIIFCAALFLVQPIVTFVVGFIGENSNNYLTCLEIADSDDIWKYKIVWDYYPYEGAETKDSFPAKYSGEKKQEYITYETEKGTITIWEDGKVDKPE